MLKIETLTVGTNSVPFLHFRRDHLRSTSGIICGSGSFAFQFEDHFGLGIICGAVQFSIGGRRHGNDLYSLIGSLQCAVWIFLSLLTVTVTLCLALWAEQHCWSIFVNKLEEIVPSFSVLFIHGAFYLQLEKLLNEVRQTTIEGREGSVLPQCALFVCNKWDQVPEEEVKEVQNHVITKLKTCWPGLDHKSQIIFASLKNAIISQNYGVINTEFFSLMSGTSSMVLKSSRARLEMHWK